MIDFYPTKLLLADTQIGGRGIGLFTLSNIPKEKLIGIYIVDKSVKNKKFDTPIVFNENNTTIFYETIPFGRYMNHSDNPNCELVFDSEIFYIRTNDDIPKGEELMVDYKIIYNHYRNKNISVKIKYNFFNQNPQNMYK